MTKAKSKDKLKPGNEEAKSLYTAQARDQSQKAKRQHSKGSK